MCFLAQEVFQAALLVPALCKGLLGSMEEIPTVLAALIMARMMNANKNALGEREKPFSHQVFSGWWLIKAGLRERLSLMQESRGEQVIQHTLQSQPKTLGNHQLTNLPEPGWASPLQEGDSLV